MDARQDGKKRPPEFGKRGRANIAGSERKPKALQRLMKIGLRVCDCSQGGYAQ
jgi:hypothetical protein